MCCVCVYAGNSMVNTNWKLCWYYSFQEHVVDPQRVLEMNNTETRECV